MDSKIVRLKLTGNAKQVVEALERDGLNERDIFAKALTLLQDVYKTKCVARIKESYLSEDIDAVEFFYTIRTEKSEKEVSNPPEDEKSR